MLLADKIKTVKEDKNAIILAHNYQPPEIQDVADIIGDSLELAFRAKEADAHLIVFCGVDFMAETAKILAPSKTVLVPAAEATCPMAHHLTPAMIAGMKRRYPNAAVVLYANSTAACKALADVTCTSANAVDIVKSMPEEMILFGPDANLAHRIQRHVPDKSIIPIPAHGHCYVHLQFNEQHLHEARKRGDKIMAHPECLADIQAEADLVASTGGMLKGADAADTWSVLTERDMAYRLKTEFPEKTFNIVEEAICHDMKLNTLQKLHWCLENEQYEILLPPEIIDKAARPIERMLEISMQQISA
jgi:quinolinate synthase